MQPRSKVTNKITPWRQKDPKQTSFQGITAGFQGSTHWTGGLQSGALQSGAYSFWGTAFGSREALTGLGPTVWGRTVWGPTSGGLQSLGHRFWVSGTTHWTGAYSLGAYIWGPTVSEHRFWVSQPKCQMETFCSGKFGAQSTDFESGDPNTCRIRRDIEDPLT